MRVHLPPDGEKLNGLLPTCVWRRCSIDDGFDASLADDDRLRVIGPNSSRHRIVIALKRWERNEWKNENANESIGMCIEWNGNRMGL